MHASQDQAPAPAAAAAPHHDGRGAAPVVANAANAAATVDTAATAAAAAGGASAVVAASASSRAAAGARTGARRGRGLRSAVLATALALLLPAAPVTEAADGRTRTTGTTKPQPAAKAKAKAEARAEAKPKAGAKARTVAKAKARAKPDAAPAARHAVRPGSGPQRQVGLASYYGAKFHGRRMADGTRLRAGSDSAASRTLPFGTVARVTNLANGRSATVTIRDRGPYGRGRIIDVSPAVARQLGMIRSGVTRVEVAVLKRPPPRPRRGR